MSEWLEGAKVEVEMTPFQATVKKNKTMITAPMAYVTDLREFLFSYLDILDE